MGAFALVEVWHVRGYLLRRWEGGQKVYTVLTHQSDSCFKKEEYAQGSKKLGKAIDRQMRVAEEDKK
jgi:hypothetical protein